MCEYCDNSKTLVEKEVPHNIFGHHGYNYDLSVYIDRGHLRLVDRDDGECLDHGEKIKINFCPVCGKDLNKEETK